MRKLLAVLLSLALTGGARAEEPKAPERALMVTISWGPGGPTVDDVHKMEEGVPLSRGLPQLAGRFFELQDASGDVLYAGSLIEGRVAQKDAPAGPVRVLMPDLEEARKIVIYQRVGGRRKVVKEHAL